MAIKGAVMANSFLTSCGDVNKTYVGWIRNAIRQATESNYFVGWRYRLSDLHLGKKNGN